MPRINRGHIEGGLGAEAAAKRLGGARREGSGWKCRCPAHDDRTASLHVSDRDDGGLLAYCFAGCTQDALVASLRVHGLDVANPFENAGRTMHLAQPSQRGGEGGEWTLIMPVPEDAPPPTLDDASAAYRYRDAAGLTLFYVARYEPRTALRKRFCPWTYWIDGNGQGAWRAKASPAPRTLYGRELLAARPDAPVLVTEGEKAAEAARAIFPDCVVVTSPNGSEAAAQADWSPLKGRSVTIWPDADKPGCDFANDVAEQAAASGAASVSIVSVPETWPNGWDLADKLPVGVTVQDLHQLVADANAANVEEPLLLVRSIPPPGPYPVDGLGSLATVVRALQETVQSPAALCANSVLASVALAAQGHVDVELPIGGGVRRPASGYFVTVGRSGERKSATDELVMKSIKARERSLDLARAKQLSAHLDELEIWTEERKKIRQNKKTDRASKHADLAALGPKPKPPLLPIILMEEPTIEGLAKLLMDGQPSVGIFSTEGGEFISGHAMKDDAKLRSAAALSKLWDAETWKRVRSGEGSNTIAHKRLSIHFMLQPGVAVELMSDPVLGDQGLLSRILVTFPESTMGTRFHREPSQDAQKVISKFNETMAGRAALPFPLHGKSQNELAPRLLRFSCEARKTWLAFVDEVEGLLGRGSVLEPISGFAAKMPEHAARIAALITWWTDPDAAEIGSAALAGAIELVRHYGAESLRLQQAAGVPQDISDAGRLLDWLNERWGESLVSVPDIVQRGPNSLRVTERARKIVDVLERHRYLRKEQGPATIRGKRHREVWAILGRPSRVPLRGVAKIAITANVDDDDLPF